MKIGQCVYILERWVEPSPRGDVARLVAVPYRVVGFDGETVAASGKHGVAFFARGGPNFYETDDAVQAELRRNLADWEPKARASGRKAFLVGFTLYECPDDRK